MTSPLVLGVDPGSKFCGLVLVRGRELVAWDLVERPDGQSVKDWVEECVERAHGFRVDAITAEAMAHMVVAVEAVEPPHSHHNGKRQLLHPEYLIGTSAVVGGVVVWAATEGYPCVLVSPGGNGSGPRQGYPAELWGTREGPAGTGKLNHVRAAFDTALAGRMMLAHGGAKR